MVWRKLVTRQENRWPFITEGPFQDRIEALLKVERSASNPEDLRPPGDINLDQLHDIQSARDMLPEMVQIGIVDKKITETFPEILASWILEEATICLGLKN